MEKAAQKNNSWLVTAAVYGLMTLIFAAASLHRESLSALCREDGAIQWGQWLFLFFSVVASILLFIKKRREPAAQSIIPFLFALFCLWVFLEEIDYGQRILHFQSPYYFQRENVHRVVNIHNLPVLDRASEVASMSILLLWSILLPIITAISNKTKNLVEKMNIPQPGIAASFGCIAGLILEFYCRQAVPGYQARSGEVLELYLYFSFFAASIEALWLTGQENPFDQKTCSGDR